jgi:hypothetical protein
MHCLLILFLSVTVISCTAFWSLNSHLQYAACIHLILCRIWGSHSGSYESCHLQGYSAVYSVCEPTFRMIVSSQSLPIHLIAHWFLARLIFDPEDGGDTSLRNVDSYGLQGNISQKMATSWSSHVWTKQDCSSDNSLDVYECMCSQFEFRRGHRLSWQTFNGFP